MAAITWQNINGPSLADAARPMESAQRSMAAAFGGLGDVLKQERDTQEANWNQGKINNKEAFLNTLYGAKSPEEMQALQKSGQLNTMLSGYGAQVADPGALRQAMEGRLGTLQQQALVSNDYQDKITDNKEAPLRDNAASLYAQGKFAEGDAVAAQVTRNKAALLEASRTGQRRTVTEGQADTTFANAQNDAAQKRLMDPLAVLQANDNLLNGPSTRGLQDAQAERLYQESIKIKNEGSLNTLAKAAYEAKVKDSILASGVVGIGKGTDTLAAGLKTAGKEPGEIKDIIENVQKAFPNGIPAGKDANGKDLYKPVPVDFVMRAASQSTGHWWNLPSLNLGGVGENTSDLMKKMLSDPKSGVLEELASAFEMKNELINKPLERDKVGSFVDPKPVTAAPNRAAMQAALKEATKNNYGVAIAPSMLEQRLLREKEMAEKKSPEIAPVVEAQTGGTAAPLNRAAVPAAIPGSKPSVVTRTEGFTLGDTGKKVEPLDTSKVVWAEADQVVKAGIDHRKKTAVVLTVASGGVKDADTIKFNNGAANGVLNDTCRVDGIDARETAKSWKKNPEPGQAYGEEAAAVLKKMIDGKQLSVTVTQSKDGTGSRSVCQIDIEGGENLSTELVKAGAAYLTERFRNTPETSLQTGQREALRVFQQDAIKNKLGMFGDTNPRNLDAGLPAPYRQRMKRLNLD